MRVANVVYLPKESDRRFAVAEFLQNLKDNPPANPLIVFSDADQPMAKRLGFEVRRFGTSFEKPQYKRALIKHPITGQTVINPAAVKNLIFLTAVRLVEQAGFTHFLMLEDDCRVKNPASGPKWDEVIFNEFFSIPKPLLMAGTTVAYNPYNHNRESALRFERYLEETRAAGRKMPISVHGSKRSDEVGGTVLFVNGALGVYSVAGINVLLPERALNDDIGFASKLYSWDWALAERCWAKFQAGSYDLIGYLSSIYSSYGNVQNSQAEREQWLAEGRFVATHQIKRKK